MSSDGAPQANRAGLAFASTQWSTVLAARSDSSTRRAALERLCQTYWKPVYHYIRRHGASPHDAQDLTQGFFAYILDSDFLDRTDPGRGRFRGYLVGTLRHFLADEHERASARKRGAGARHIEWNSADAEHELIQFGDTPLDPSVAYDKSWALTLLARALTRLTEEQASAGKSRAFEALKPYLTHPAEPGDYARLAEVLGIRRAAVAVAVHRLKHRYIELVRLEVSETVSNPDDVRVEMEHLLTALRQ